jgi:4-amino-4-deoxy-L-arabinose transferase-like glycosyltransferase
MKKLPILLILLLALALRSWELTAVPPGLTHDEANHGREAIGILDGIILFYFPLNYGSEPLYSYLVAGLMGLMGEHLLALRLVNVYFGLGALAALYAWTRRQFDRRTAVIAAALIAVSFWPLATSRQALRAGVLPFLVVTAVIFFWQIGVGSGKVAAQKFAAQKVAAQRWAVIGFGAAVALTFYNYLAARVLWLMFPLFLIYLFIWQRERWAQIWRPVLTGLILAGALVAPMFIYLRFNPQAQTRLDMLDGPLQALLAGNIGPALNNGVTAVLALFVNGYGDHFLAYNIPGRPVLDVVTALFFLIGLGVCLWRWRQPIYPFVLFWLLAGLLPSLITGPEANTTRNLGALPVLYLIPAIGFTAVWAGIARQGARAQKENPGVLAPWRAILPLSKQTTAVALILWLLFVGAQTSRAYFYDWAQSPDVRAAYQHTLISGLTYVQAEAIAGPIVVSSVYPGVAHDPSIALAIVGDEAERLQWVDGRLALLFPRSQPAHLLLPASTPLHPSFAPFVEPLNTINLRADDLDPYFTVNGLAPAGAPPVAPLANFNNGLHLLAARWSVNPVQPGDVIELITLWRVADAANLGPPAPPLDSTDLVLFTHVLRDDMGGILTQADRLDAPSWSWQTGDQIIQVHQMYLPPETLPGVYEVVVGVYDRESGARLPSLNEAGEVVDNRAFVVSLQAR